VSIITDYLGEDAASIEARLLDRIRRYVERETPSGDHARISALADVVGNDLERLGAKVEQHDAPGLGRNLVARFSATDPADPTAKPLLMLAHMDTVHEVGTLRERPFSIHANGRAEGPGVYDMKAGLSLLIEAMAWHRARETKLRRAVVLLITCDEEIGSHSSRALIDRHARAAHTVLVPEPCLPDGGVKTSRKGVATYRIETTGIAAHAGSEPGTTVSAISELVHQCDAILDLADHSKGTTINIGVIGGGTATNVVAPEAFAGIEVRLAAAGEFERVDAALRALKPTHAKAGVRIAAAENRPPLIRTANVEAAYSVARACAAELGVDLPEGLSGGGSDGSLAAATGVAVLDGLGPQGGGAHAVDEHILISDLPFRLALICRLIERL
jgi:glutamate carboxypeptidase